MVVLTAAKTIDLVKGNQFPFALLNEYIQYLQGQETQVNPQVTIPAIGTHRDRHTYSTLVYQFEISE